MNKLKNLEDLDHSEEGLLTPRSMTPSSIDQ